MIESLNSSSRTVVDLLMPCGANTVSLDDRRVLEDT